MALLFSRCCISEELIAMSPVKSESRTNATKQRAEAAKKGLQAKNVRQNDSRSSQTPSKGPNRKQKCKGNSTTLEDRNTDVQRGNRRQKEDEGKRRDTEQKGPQKQVRGTLGPGTPGYSRSQLKHSKDSNVKHSPKTPPNIQGRTKNKLLPKPDNKQYDKVIESKQAEEELESDEGSSAEMTEEETSSDEKEEERGSNEESAETQLSEESSEEEAEATDTERDTEQTADKDSNKELTEESKSRSGEESREEEEEEEEEAEEEENKEEVEISEDAISDVGDDKEIIQEVTSENPATDKACRRRRQTQPVKPEQGLKYKMFKKTKADKQAEKAEKQRAKAEKQKLEKEAKQKAKEEKKNKKKLLKEDKPSSAMEEFQPPNKVGKAKGITQLANKTKNNDENDAPVEADLVNPDEEEEEQNETILTKAIKGQNRIMLLKAKGKDLKAFLEPEEQQDPEIGVKGRPQSLLLGKVKMASLRQKANKMLKKSVSESF